MTSERVLTSRMLAAGAGSGSGSGRALVLDEPLSLWGGVDPATGEIIDGHHPQHGASIAGRVLVMASGRGSSSSSSILAEAVRAGTAPSAIIVAEADLILAVGAVVARELYGQAPPVVQVSAADLGRIPDGVRLTIAGDGVIVIDARSDGPEHG